MFGWGSKCTICRHGILHPSKSMDIVQAIGIALRNRDQRKNLDMSLFQYLSKKIKMKLNKL